MEYKVTVHRVEEAMDIPSPENCRLHTVVALSPHAIACVWQTSTPTDYTWTAEATKAWLEAPVPGGG